MAVKRIARPRARAQLSTGTLVADDPSVVSRHLSELADAVTNQGAGSTAGQTVSLVVGDNRVNHTLGRKALGVHITPTVADATFAWAMTAADDKQVTISCIGVAQPNAYVEIL